MNKLNILLFFIMGFCASIYGQTQMITVEDIYQGVFRTEGLDALQSISNGKQYTVLNVDRSNGNVTVDKYDYKTLTKVETIVSSTDLTTIKTFSSYEFTADETKLLLATEIEPIFGHSKGGIFY